MNTKKKTIPKIGTDDSDDGGSEEQEQKNDENDGADEQEMSGEEEEGGESDKDNETVTAMEDEESEDGGDDEEVEIVVSKPGTTSKSSIKKQVSVHERDKLSAGLIQLNLRESVNLLAPDEYVMQPSAAAAMSDEDVQKYNDAILEPWANRIKHVVMPVVPTNPPAEGAEEEASDDGACSPFLLLGISAFEYTTVPSEVAVTFTQKKYGQFTISEMMLHNQTLKPSGRGGNKLPPVALSNIQGRAISCIGHRVLLSKFDDYGAIVAWPGTETVDTAPFTQPITVPDVETLPADVVTDEIVASAAVVYPSWCKESIGYEAPRLMKRELVHVTLADYKKILERERAVALELSEKEGVKKALVLANIESLLATVKSILSKKQQSASSVSAPTPVWSPPSPPLADLPRDKDGCVDGSRVVLELYNYRMLPLDKVKNYQPFDKLKDEAPVFKGKKDQPPKTMSAKDNFVKHINTLADRDNFIFIILKYGLQLPPDTTIDRGQFVIKVPMVPWPCYNKWIKSPQFKDDCCKIIEARRKQPLLPEETMAKKKKRATPNKASASDAETQKLVLAAAKKKQAPQKSDDTAAGEDEEEGGDNDETDERKAVPAPPKSKKNGGVEKPSQIIANASKKKVSMSTAQSDDEDEKVAPPAKKSAVPVKKVQEHVSLEQVSDDDDDDKPAPVQPKKIAKKEIKLEPAAPVKNASKKAAVTKTPTDEDELPTEKPTAPINNKKRTIDESTPLPEAMFSSSRDDDQSKIMELLCKGAKKYNDGTRPDNIRFGPFVGFSKDSPPSQEVSNAVARVIQALNYVQLPFLAEQMLQAESQWREEQAPKKSKPLKKVEQKAPPADELSLDYD